MKSLGKKAPTKFPAPLSQGSSVRVQGFTLIEILIALLVLSIGLIGIAALHLVSLQNAHSSYHTSLASSIALDFEERLWLRMGSDGSAACITNEDVFGVADEDGMVTDGVVTELQSLWGDGGDGDRDHVEIPGVTITAGDVSGPSGANYHAEVTLTITWTDKRFEDATNEFQYLARVPCFDPDFEPD